MDPPPLGIAGRAVLLALGLPLGGVVAVVATAACEAIVTDSLPILPCQADDDTPSETCPSGQTCGDAGWCVALAVCDDSGGACPADGASGGSGDAGGDSARVAPTEGGLDAIADGPDNSLGDGSGEAAGDDSGDDGGDAAATCENPGSFGLGCPCTDSTVCGPKAPHCMMPDALDAGTADSGGDASLGYCSHGCKTDDECAPLQCSALTRACAP